MVDFVADAAQLLAAFANCTITVRRAGADDLVFDAIFDDSYKTALGVGTTDPQFTALAANLEAVSKGGTVITIEPKPGSGITPPTGECRIKAIEPDGAGMVTVTLTADTPWR